MKWNITSFHRADAIKWNIASSHRADGMIWDITSLHRADAMKWNIASSHGALPQTSFAYYGVFQFFHHNSGTIYVILCCDMSNINLHLVVKWNFWWHLESSTINGFRDSMSCHVTWNLHWLMENQRGYMGVHERSNPSLNEGYMEKQRRYMRGTWEIKTQFQWRVHGE